MHKQLTTARTSRMYQAGILKAAGDGSARNEQCDRNEEEEVDEKEQHGPRARHSAGATGAARELDDEEDHQPEKLDARCYWQEPAALQLTQGGAAERRAHHPEHHHVVQCQRLQGLSFARLCQGWHFKLRLVRLRICHVAPS